MILEYLTKFDFNIIYFEEFSSIKEELNSIIDIIQFHNFLIYVVKKHTMKSLHLNKATKTIQYNFNFH